jgi:hypothetical protein
MAFNFFIYGVLKLTVGQFGEPSSDMAALKGGGFILAWTFFGYSSIYEIFIGRGEVIAAVLILIPRTSTIGAMIYFPIAVNVMLVNYCFDIGVQDLSTILTGMCFVLLWLDRRKFIPLLAGKEARP